MSVSSTVNVRDINIYNQSIIEQSTALGLTPVPVGDAVPIKTQKVLNQIRKLAIARYGKISGATPLPDSNYDSAYMGPLSSVPTDGSAPKCAVDTIHSDFASWGMPLSDDDAVPKELASQIVKHVVSKGGQPGTFSGTHQVTSSEFIWWSVAWMVVQISQTETGVLYTFCADWGYEIVT